MTLKFAHEDTKAIWKWLSKYSSLNLSSVENKIRAMEAIGIDVNLYSDYNHCPYCKKFSITTGNAKKSKCLKCVIYKKYVRTCGDIGYSKWCNHSTPENALVFYNNIKDLK